MILDFFSFHPRNIDTSIAHVGVIDHPATDFLLDVGECSSSSLLTLNLSLLVSKTTVQNTSLNTTLVARNLGFMFDTFMCYLLRSEVITF